MISITDIILFPLLLFVAPALLAVALSKNFSDPMKIFSVILSVVLSWFGLLIVVGIRLIWNR